MKSAAAFGDEMKQIDHDPHEHLKIPGQGEKQWAKAKWGREPTPMDLLWYILPIAAVAIVLHLMRGY